MSENPGQLRRRLFLAFVGEEKFGGHRAEVESATVQPPYILRFLTFAMARDASPAQAVVYGQLKALDSGLHRNDGNGLFQTFCKTIKINFL